MSAGYWFYFCVVLQWREACGAVVRALVLGSGGSNPTAVSMSLCPWDTSPQIAPVGIAHSIEYVSRFG